MVLVDAVTIIVFLTAYTLAFIGGLGRAALALLTSLVVLIAAAAFTVPVAGVVHGLSSSFPDWASELLALLIIMAIFAFVTPLVITRAIVLVPQVRRSTARVQGVTGIVLLAVLAFAFAVVVTVTLGMLVGNLLASLPPGGSHQTIIRAMNQSLLFPGLARLSPLVVHLAIAWVPGPHPQLLQPLSFPVAPAPVRAIAVW